LLDTKLLSESKVTFVLHLTLTLGDDPSLPMLRGNQESNERGLTAWQRISSNACTFVYFSWCHSGPWDRLGRPTVGCVHRRSKALRSLILVILGHLALILNACTSKAGHGDGDWSQGAREWIESIGRGEQWSASSPWWDDIQSAMGGSRQRCSGWILAARVSDGSWRWCDFLAAAWFPSPYAQFLIEIQRRQIWIWREGNGTVQKACMQKWAVEVGGPICKKKGTSPLDLLWTSQIAREHGSTDGAQDTSPAASCRSRVADQAGQSGAKATARQEWAIASAQGNTSPWPISPKKVHAVLIRRWNLENLGAHSFSADDDIRIQRRRARGFVFFPVTRTLLLQWLNKTSAEMRKCRSPK
jgi:hypothetical protein